MSSSVTDPGVELRQISRKMQHHAERMRHVHMDWAGSSDLVGAPDLPCCTNVFPDSSEISHEQASDIESKYD